MAWNSGPLTTKQIVDQNLPNPFWKKTTSISNKGAEGYNTSEVYKQISPPSILEDASYNTLNRFPSQTYINKNQSMNELSRKSVKSDLRKDEHSFNSRPSYGALKKLPRSPKRENLLSAVTVLKKLKSAKKCKKFDLHKSELQTFSSQGKLNVQKIVINVSQGKVFHKQECDRNQLKATMLPPKLSNRDPVIDTNIITMTKKIKQEPFYSEASCSEGGTTKLENFKRDLNTKPMKPKLIHVDHIVTCCGHCESDLNDSISSSRFCLLTGNVSVTCQSCGTVTIMYHVYRIPKF